MLHKSCKPWCPYSWQSSLLRDAVPVVSQGPVITQPQIESLRNRDRVRQPVGNAVMKIDCNICTFLLSNFNPDLHRLKVNGNRHILMTASMLKRFLTSESLDLMFHGWVNRLRWNHWHPCGIQGVGHQRYLHFEVC